MAFAVANAALHEASDDDKRAFIAACVRAMEEHAEGRADDGRARAICLKLEAQLTHLRL